MEAQIASLQMTKSTWLISVHHATNADVPCRRPDVEEMNLRSNASTEPNASAYVAANTISSQALSIVTG